MAFGGSSSLANLQTFSWLPLLSASFLLSVFRCSFSPTSFLFSLSFSTRIPRCSALVRILAPDTRLEDALDFGIASDGKTRNVVNVGELEDGDGEREEV